MQTSATARQLTEEWLEQHFDYLAPELGAGLHPALRHLRERCPVARSDAYGGYWVVTSYDDVLRIARDWETFSSELGVGIKPGPVAKAIPEHIDPPLHSEYKRLISAYFTPAVVRPYEDRVRGIVSSLIDEFVEAGRCDFMADFAVPFPGLVFFELVLDAPRDQLAEVNRLASQAANPTNPDRAACWAGLTAWIGELVEQRRRGAPRGDVVDGIVAAQIQGRPITDEEIRALILLLILGGLDTTAGALGHMVLRLCREPEIPALLRGQPELVPDAVEELLRLEGSFVAIGRTVRHDTEIGGHSVRQGEKVLISWASANRDEAEFPQAERFDPHRTRNRHLTFGAGPHRCAGSNLARLNLRVAVGEIVRRLPDLTLLVPEAEVPFHSAFNRSPLSLPIAFSPGPRLGG